MTGSCWARTDLQKYAFISIHSLKLKHCLLANSQQTFDSKFFATPALCLTTKHLVLANLNHVLAQIELDIVKAQKSKQQHTQLMLAIVNQTRCQLNTIKLVSAGA